MHAAAFIRNREVVLESDLLVEPRMLRLIFVHEMFHFVWARLGNGARREFADLLAAEFAARARGELGESASVAKDALTPGDRQRSSRAWRNYACESFCDTAARLYSGVRRHSFTLKRQWVSRRERWFRAAFESGCRC